MYQMGSKEATPSKGKGNKCIKNNFAYLNAH